MALERDPGDDPGLGDGDIAASLDAAIPLAGDVVVLQADVAAALRTLGGLGLAAGGVSVATAKASDLTRRLVRLKEPF